MTDIEMPILTRPAPRWYFVSIRSIEPNRLPIDWRGPAYDAKDAAVQARIWARTMGFVGVVTCVAPTPYGDAT